jgi:ankyrin repeat protein
MSEINPDINSSVKTYNTIFDLIKNHEWDKLIEKISSSDTDFDVNIKDQTNNYIITYAVIYNQQPLVKMLFEHNARIDILDADEKSILYYPIKFSYDSMLEYLLKLNKDMIGINIIELKDKTSKTALHYAIKFSNIFSIEKLLEYGSNTNTIDNSSYNALHYAILSRDINICEIILRYTTNINAKISTGETALHIACNLQLESIAKLLIDARINLSVQDYQHEFTAMHYCMNLNLEKTLINLLKNKANPNVQDIFGNTPLHYAIIENNLLLIDILIEYSSQIINYNLSNIDGKIPLHLLLNSYSETKSDNDRKNILEYISMIISESNLSSRDNNGESCLFLLVKLNLWSSFKEILQSKRLDIYSTDKKNIMLIDLIPKASYKEFMEIVLESYIRRLKRDPSSWKTEWENICSKEFDSTIDVTRYFNKTKTSSKTKISSKTELATVCKNHILTQIESNIDDIRSGKKHCGMASYPLAPTKMCITLEEGETLHMCTFTGTTLDILIGLIYLLRTHRTACSTLSTDFYSNEDLQKFYKSIGIIMGSKSEFLNFEIIWAYQKLYLVENFYDKIMECKKNAEFVIIPLGIEMSNGSHANYIIYDIKNKTVERFEPHGASSPNGLNYDPSILDELLESRFKTIDKEIVYYAPSDYEPKIGFQMLDIFEHNKKKIGDPGGFCALWAIWYVDMRLRYKNLNCKELTKILTNAISNQNISVRNMIRNYAKKIIEIRDKILGSAGLDINDWLNDTYTSKQITQIIQEIQSQIMSV